MPDKRMLVLEALSDEFTDFDPFLGADATAISPRVQTLARSWRERHLRRVLLKHLLRRFVVALRLCEVGDVRGASIALLSADKAADGGQTHRVWLVHVQDRLLSHCAYIVASSTHLTR